MSSPSDRAHGPSVGPGAPHQAVEAEPASAITVFGARMDRARRYAALLAGAGVQRGLIGPREAGRLWSRHLLNCAVLAELVPQNVRVVDIGSGAGLPGIPLALARPDLRVELVEPLLRRSIFLQEAVEDLGLANCRVVRARAEDAVALLGGGVPGGAGAVAGVEVVTARAVAPLGRLAGWAGPLLRPDGILLALKGSGAGDEVERDGAALTAAGFGGAEVVTVGSGLVDPPATVVRAAYTEAGYSRAASLSGRKPRAVRSGRGVRS